MDEAHSEDKEDERVFEYSPGQIYDRRVWSRQLTDQEIYDLYRPETRWDLYKPRPFPGGR